MSTEHTCSSCGYEWATTGTTGGVTLLCCPACKTYKIDAAVA